jgi:hypothetical protein
MPHPFCTSTHIRLPPVGRLPLASSGREMHMGARISYDRFRGVLRHEKSPRGTGEYPNGLKMP